MAAVRRRMPRWVGKRVIARASSWPMVDWVGGGEVCIGDDGWLAGGGGLLFSLLVSGSWFGNLFSFSMRFSSQHCNWNSVICLSHFLGRVPG